MAVAATRETRTAIPAVRIALRIALPPEKSDRQSRNSRAASVDEAPGGPFNRLDRILQHNEADRARMRVSLGIRSGVPVILLAPRALHSHAD
jgi:hypothetical protein